MALEIGNKVRTYVAAAGLGLSAMTMGVTAATAQEVNAITRTTFSSLWEAGTHAQSKGMVLARAYNGEMRFVSRELAQILDEQGFEMRQGILYGYTQQSFGDFLDGLFSGTLSGYNFARGSDYLGANSMTITIEGSQGGNDNDDGTDTFGGTDDGDDDGDDDGTDTF